jgi:large subunit ribosomal protein L6
MPINLPSGVSAELSDGLIKVSGPKGQQTLVLPPLCQVKLSDQTITVQRSSEEKSHKAQHGLTRALINNLVLGVTEGFSKELEVNGVGFKLKLEGKTLIMSLGFSHDIRYNVPEDVDVSVDKMEIKVSGSNKQRVGQVAAEIREFKKPEPYKGKGIRYKTERIVRKAGKSGK